MQVPKWNTHYPSLHDANKKQKEFYKRFKNSLEEEKVKIEIEDNISYVFVYLYDLIEKFIKGKRIDELISKFEIIGNFYGNYETISIYIHKWLTDAHLYNNDYENAWKTLKLCKYVSIEDIIYIGGNCKEKSINSELLLTILRSDTGLTKFGKEYIDDISQLVNIFLDDFYFEKNTNYAEYFLNHYDYGGLTEKDLEILKNYYSNERDYLLWKEDYLKTQISKRPYPKKYHHYLFSGAPLTSTPYFERENIPYIISVALSNEFKRIFREAEDTVRVEKNLPKVGEGWINETELFYKLCIFYKNEKIIHHGKPHWLKRQHLDIYFPEKNIGIEYQGAQHLEPIAYFGGLESFEKQQELDRKKQELCNRNDCHLIYVFENYNFNELVIQINQLL